MADVHLESVCQNLQRLGLSVGDTVLIRADLSSLGIRPQELRKDFLNRMLTLVGPTGTLVSLTFTDFFPIKKLPDDYIFNENTRSNAGALANLFLQFPGRVRSKHPTNSFAAIGANANRVCTGHDAAAPAYLPIKTLLELDAKFLLLGCVGTSPGFTTVHWVQHELGLAQKSRMRNRSGVYYETPEGKAVFRRSDVGGCSLGFGKFYAHYVRAGKLVTGYVGCAYSAMIRARDAYEIETAILQRDPTFALCENPDCFSCRASWRYNYREMPSYYVRRVVRRIRALWHSGRRNGG